MKKALFVQILSIFILAVSFVACNKTVTEPDTLSKTVPASLSKKTKKEIKWELPKEAMNVDTTYNVSIPADSGEMSPMAFEYGTRVIKYDAWDEKYKPVSGLFICISGSASWTFKELHDVWGYSGAMIGSATDWTNRINEGYDANNLMVGLYGYNYEGSRSALDAYVQQFPNATKFFIDEPNERGWSNQNIIDAAQVVQSRNNSAIIGIAEYTMTNTSGQGRLNYLMSQYNNLYIMCDEYKGNANGPTAAYWSYYRTHFLRQFTNWMSSIYNDGSYWSFWLNNYNNSFYDLFGTANDYGFKSIWICMEPGTNGGQIQNLSNSAWRRGWLLKHMLHWQVYQECLNPEAPPEEQVWETVTATSNGTGYFPY